MKILLIGNGAREHVIASKLKENKNTQIYNFASDRNPGLLELSEDLMIGQTIELEQIIKYAEKIKPDLVWIGPEGPLEKGAVDQLKKINILSVGPVQNLAKIETSKSFARKLLSGSRLQVCPKFKIFSSETGLKEFIKELDQFVIKPDGLTGGKGVLVQGDHFQSHQEGMELVQEIIRKNNQVIIEEKLIGQEFSLMSFVDGKNLVHMPVVQDHKRVFVDDKGPNTGGMGSYSDVNHSLPFLKKEDIETAQKINEETIKMLPGYKGILYGGFIAVRNGVKLIEYNARFGDPEAINVLFLLETDLTEISQHIINGSLDKIKINFEKKATVCKYVVPEGYPEKPVRNEIIDVSRVDQNKVKLFYASINKMDNELYLKGSRAVALVAKDETLEKAEGIVQKEIVKIRGPVFFREDIGTRALIDKRIEMLKEIRNG